MNDVGEKRLKYRKNFREKLSVKCASKMAMLSQLTVVTQILARKLILINKLGPKKSLLTKTPESGPLLEI